MHLTDLLSLENWKIFEEEITARSGLDANVFNTDGRRITDYKSWANRLCPAVKATDKGQAFICAVAHMNLAAQAARSEKAVIEECDAGLVKMVVPIFAKGEYVGAVGACGMLLDEGEVDSFLVNKITGIEEDTVENLSQGMGRITTEKLEALAGFIEERIGKIVRG
jgi:ligand-binding sensor protein